MTKPTPIKIHKTHSQGSAVNRFWILSFVVVCLVISYGTLLVATTVSSSDVRKLDKDISQAKSKIATYEVAYFTKASQITSADVAEFNMVQPTEDSLAYVVLDPGPSQFALGTNN